MTDATVALTTEDIVIVGLVAETKEADGPAHLIFLIAAPDGADDKHLHILAALARKLVHEDFRQSLRDANTGAEIAAIITREVQQ